MPALFSDPPFAVYLVLGAFVIIAGVIAASRQERRSLIRLGIAIASLLLVYLLDALFESPREGAVSSAKAMADAADKHDPAGFVAQVADTVEFNDGNPHKITREQLRTSGFWQMLKQYSVHVAVWDFSREYVHEIDENTIEIGFLAKGESPQGQYPLFIRATFTKQSDGKMKLTKFATFRPENHNEPLSIPNFP